MTAVPIQTATPDPRPPSARIDLPLVTNNLAGVERETMEVDVLIVGGGPAGLACAIRLGQLLEEHPDVRERLGDVPIAVLEKGKQAGSHLLSGAVMSPKPLAPSRVVVPVTGSSS